jgi:ABC-type branched-subunit amino acid transport system permease subunit
VFLLIWLVVCAAVFAAAVGLGNDYIFFASYVVLQYVVLGTAWNILGGYCGYVNFGSAAFFALGAYSTVTIYRLITEPAASPTINPRTRGTTSSMIRSRLGSPPITALLGSYSNADQSPVKRL